MTVGGRAKVSITIPQTPGEAALVLVDQMRTAIMNGQVAITDNVFRGGINAWLNSADRVLEMPADETRWERDVLIAALKPFAIIEPGYLRIPPEWFNRARDALGLPRIHANGETETSR